MYYDIITIIIIIIINNNNDNDNANLLVVFQFIQQPLLTSGHALLEQIRQFNLQALAATHQQGSTAVAEGDEAGLRRGRVFETVHSFVQGLFLTGGGKRRNTGYFHSNGQKKRLDILTTPPPPPPLLLTVTTATTQSQQITIPN